MLCVTPLCSSARKDFYRVSPSHSTQVRHSACRAITHCTKAAVYSTGPHLLPQHICMYCAHTTSLLTAPAGPCSCRAGWAGWPAAQHNTARHTTLLQEVLIPCGPTHGEPRAHASNARMCDDDSCQWPHVTAYHQMCTDLTQTSSAHRQRHWHAPRACTTTLPPVIYLQLRPAQC